MTAMAVVPMNLQKIVQFVLIEKNKVIMELIIKPFSGLPCELETFTINGKDANSMDFGDVYNHDNENAEPYGCGDMYFEPRSPTIEVLDRYNIIEEEYYNICNELEDKLRVGSCGWCV